jgi:hypothetical protein
MHPKTYVEEAINKEIEDDSTWKLTMEAERDARNHLGGNLEKASEGNGNQPPNTRLTSEAPWYLKLFMPITVPSKMLYDQFLEFYTFYGATRFWSGVALALIFTFYIESLRKEAKKRFSRTKEEVGG